jgi:methionine synthase / methylenetetrahydrofolate reductase(NADPH)
MIHKMFNALGFIKIVEIVPPKLSTILPPFFDRVASLQQEVDCFSVPSNPMGNIHMANAEVCREITLFSKKPAILHLPVKGRDLLHHESHLLAAHQMGIRHLFIIMGDRSSTSLSSLDTTDLVRLVKEKFNQGFNSLNDSIGEATKFLVGCAVNLTPNQQDSGHKEPRFQMERLHLKIQAGADYLITQPIFDVEKAGSFIEGYERLYGPIPIPIFPGIVPFGTYEQMQACSKIPGIDIPSFVSETFSRASFSDDSLKFSTTIIEQLKTIHPMIKGIYLIPSFSSLPLVKDILQFGG